MSDTPQLLLAHHLKALKLPTFLREYDKQARQCAAEGVDHVRYLVRLTELELIDRERRMVERRIRMAKFPAVKSLDSFDFKAMPSLNKMMVLELARCEYIERRENVIALGNSGTGDLPPLTGSKRLVRETGHLGPRKKWTSGCPRSVFQSSRLLVTSVKQRFSWLKARRLARYAGISEYRNRVTIDGVGSMAG